MFYCRNTIDIVDTYKYSDTALIKEILGFIAFLFFCTFILFLGVFRAVRRGFTVSLLDSRKVFRYALLITY